MYFHPSFALFILMGDFNMGLEVDNDLKYALEND